LTTGGNSLVCRRGSLAEQAHLVEQAVADYVAPVQVRVGRDLVQVIMDPSVPVTASSFLNCPGVRCGRAQSGNLHRRHALEQPVTLRKIKLSLFA
jgi:hypothetical protein